MLRVSVAGGGCSGFQYRVRYRAHARADDDVVIERSGATVLIDPDLAQPTWPAPRSISSTT